MNRALHPKGDQHTASTFGPGDGRLAVGIHKQETANPYPVTRQWSKGGPWLLHAVGRGIARREGLRRTGSYMSHSGRSPGDGVFGSNKTS